MDTAGKDMGLCFYQSYIYYFGLFIIMNHFTQQTHNNPLSSAQSEQTVEWLTKHFATMRFERGPLYRMWGKYIGEVAGFFQFLLQAMANLEQDRLFSLCCELLAPWILTSG